MCGESHQASTLLQRVDETCLWSVFVCLFVAAVVVSVVVLDLFVCVSVSLF